MTDKPDPDTIEVSNIEAATARVVKSDAERRAEAIARCDHRVRAAYDLLLLAQADAREATDVTHDTARAVKGAADATRLAIGKVKIVMAWLAK